MTHRTTSRPGLIRGLLLAALLLGGGGYVARHDLLPDHAAPAPVAEAPMTVSVVTARPRMIAREIVAGGTIVARDEALVTARLEGVPVTELLVEVGDSVVAGQPLARLDRRQLDLQLAQKTAGRAVAEAAIAEAEALLAEAEASAEEARVAAGRASALRARDNLSAQALEERETAVAMATARVAARRNALAAARAALLRIEAERDELSWELEQTTLRATATGTVIARDAVLGQATPGDGTPLFRLLADGAIEMEASVVETALPGIRAGQAALVTVPGQAAPVEGRIRLVSPRVDPATRMGRVWISLPEGVAPTGASASATFRSEPRAAIVVPRTAVLSGELGPRVQVVEDGAVAVRAVVTGTADAEGVEIRSGLGEGEIVVARAGGFLRDGGRVAPVIAEGDS